MELKCQIVRARQGPNHFFLSFYYPEHAKNPALVSTAATERPFRELIAALESLKKDGIKRPPRKQVSLRLRQMQLTIYHESGFKHYLSVAAAGGYVKIGGGLPNEKKWVSLP
jgi:hypothetical protein